MEELEELRAVAKNMLLRYEDEEAVSDYIESCREEWEVYNAIRGAAMHLPMRLIIQSRKASSNYRESALITEINMERRIRCDSRMLKNEMEHCMDQVSGKDRIIEMMKKEAAEASSQNERLKQQCAELATENTELKKHRIERLIVGILEWWQKRHQRRDLYRLNRMFNDVGSYSEAQQLFLIDLVQSGITFKEIRKIFPSPDMSIEVMQRLKEYV